MKSAYRYLAYLLAIEVVVQAAAIAFAIFGLTKWIDDGGTLDKAAMEDESTTFTGVVGFIIHGINGQMVIPLLAIILLIVSFFAKVPGGSKWAAVILVAIIAQVLMGIFGNGLPALGIVHGVNALFIFAAAVMAGKRVSTGSSAHLASERV
ncbi:MAG: hypothetical protein M3Q98_12225 [Actinomycetota bacterium]|nr:hypothetical protein [Actinomycetota bacterium]